MSHRFTHKIFRTPSNRDFTSRRGNRNGISPLADSVIELSTRTTVVLLVGRSTAGRVHAHHLKMICVQMKRVTLRGVARADYPLLDRIERDADNGSLRYWIQLAVHPIKSVPCLVFRRSLGPRHDKSTNMGLLVMTQDPKILGRGGKHQSLYVSRLRTVRAFRVDGGDEKDAKKGRVPYETFRPKQSWSVAK